MNTKGLAFPKPKDIRKKRKKEKVEKDFCIMPENKLYSTVRVGNLRRHEIFYGTENRQLSIKYGLVVFLTDEMHNMSSKGIHFNKQFDLEVKRIGEKAFMDYYNKTEDEFIEIFGRSYL